MLQTNKLKSHSLSELSFIILTDNYNLEEKNDAYSEVKRRFSSTGCSYDSFMYEEEMCIARRGSNIDNYLIGPGANAQLLMELYFNHVFNRETCEHGNLLFSEVLLCNSNSDHSFFKKMVKIEMKNIKDRLISSNLSGEDVKKLQLVYEILEKRYNRKQSLWYENSLTDAVFDMVGDLSSLSSEKREEKLEKILERKTDLSEIIGFIYASILDSEILDYLNMIHIANSDLSRLKMQKKAIIDSLKYGGGVDYSFIDSKKLVLSTK